MKHLVNLSSRSQSAAHSLSGLLPRWSKWVGLTLLLAGLQSAFGFALLGPINETYQAVIIGYGLGGGDKISNPFTGARIFGNGGVDNGAPKDFNQGYRRNTPVMYYSMDANFLTYFGTNGINAVDQAYQVFNNLPAASQMSADLSEFPLNTTRVNASAEALELEDLKSTLMCVMMEQLGAAEPERYVWAMHDRYVPPGDNCGRSFLVVKRNFDPVTILPTSYVNGTLYSYVIVELCDRPGPPPWRAVCEAVAVDPLAETWNAVADYSLGFGRLYTGLTRDDVGLIHYLLRTNNLANEEPPMGSLAMVTNTTQAHFLVTSNLTEFAQVASTTNATALQAIYPGLVVTGSTNWWIRFNTTNLVLLGYKNSPYDPIGTPPHIPVYQTNWTINWELRYQHTFGNVVTFKYGPTGVQTLPVTTLTPFQGHAFVTLQTTTAAPSPWDASGSQGTNSTTPSATLVTNITSRSYLTNAPVGDFVILNTNVSSCGVFAVAALYTNVYSTTNLITATTSLATNTVPNNGTNTVDSSTNATVFSQSLVQYYTNHFLWVYDVDCLTNTAALRQGIEKITFVRRDFDSLLSRFFYPVTNQYTMMTVANNGTLTPQVVQRVITTPDFLLSGQDLNAGPSGLPTASALTRSIQFNTNDVATYYSGNAGPGTIEPGSSITFNTSTPVWGNVYEGSEATQVIGMIWGSYDMSTNAPIVYPNSTSLAELETLVLIQVTPVYLPSGTLNVPYQVQLQTQGATPKWQPPFSWDLAPGSGPLPAGLTVNADGSITGTPAERGTFNVVVQVTDVHGLTYNRAYPLVIN